MGKIVLHLGAHRTATTYIQNVLRKNGDGLAKQNWRFIKGHRDHPEVFRPIAAIARGGELSDESREEVAQFFDDIRRDSRNAFISSEVVFGPMADISKFGDFYPDPAIAGNILKAHLSGCDVQVLYCVRNFADFIESSYKFLLGRSISQSFAEFVRPLEPRKITWLSVVDALMAAFGRENLVIWAFEDFRPDSAANLRTLLEIVGIDGASFSISESRMNQSVPSDLIKPLIAFNKAIEARHLKPIEEERAKRILRKAVASLPDRNRDPLLDGQTREALSANYRDELDRIENLAGLTKFRRRSAAQGWSSPN